MVHSIELLLDAESEAAIRDQWRRLAEAELPSEHRPGGGNGARPYITVIACGQIPADTAASLSPQLSRALPLSVVIGAPMIFGTAKGRRPTLLLVRHVVPSVEMLQLQQAVVAGCPPAVDDHFAVGRWVPHITMGRRFKPEQLGPAMQALAPSLAAETGTGGRDAVVTGCRFWQGDRKLAQDLVS